MMKRALAAALCLMLVFALLPKTARAAYPTNVKICGCDLESSTLYYHNGTNGGQGTVDNDSNSANAHYDPMTGVLTLRGLNVVDYYDSADDVGIKAMGHGGNDLLTIELEGINAVSMFAGSAIFIQNCSLSIEGSGTLTAIGGVDHNYSTSCGINVGGDITISGGSVTCKGGPGGASSHGVRAAGSITVSGGALTGEGNEADSSSGVTATASITASGGSITGTGGVATIDEGYSCGVYVEDDSGFIRVVNGGSITGTGKEAYGGYSYGLYAEGAIDMIKEEGSSDTDGGTIKGTAERHGAHIGYGVWTKGLISLPADNFRIEGKGEMAFYNYPNSFPGDGVYYWRTDENGAYEHSDGWRSVSSELYFDVRSPQPVITFSTQPASTTVTEGNITGSLTAAANASPGDEVTLNWYACDASGTPTGTSLGTGGAFAIPTTLTAGTYRYLCQATCPGATSVNSNVATVTVMPLMHVLIWGEELAAGKPYYKNGANGTKGTTHATAENWNAYYDAPSGTLRLNGLNVVKSLGRANSTNTQSTKEVLHGIYAGGDIIIELAGENTVSTGDASMIGTEYSIPGSFHAVHVDGNLVLRGSGSLTATAGSRSGTNFGASYGVCVESLLTVENCTLTAAGGADSTESHGVHADMFTVKNNAQVTATGGNTSKQSYGIRPNRGLKLDGAVLTAIGGASSDASYGVFAAGVDIEIIGGRLEAQTRESTSTNKGAFALEIYPSKFTLPNVYYWRTASGDAYTSNLATAFDIRSPLTKTYTYIDIRDSLPISFTTQPAANTSVIAGSITGSLTAAANISPSGTATLNWYACSASGTPTGSSLGTGGTFAIPPTLTEGTYYYLCQASCPSAALNSNVATVTVNAAPVVVPTVAISPKAAFMQGNAPEIKITVGAGIAGFGLGNFVSAEMGPQGGALTLLTDGTDYDKAAGSIIITLHKSYLDTLAPGVYTLRIHLTGVGYTPFVETTIIVNAPGAGDDVGADVPQTGDAATPVLWIGLLLLAGAGFAVSRRRRQNG